MLSGFHCFSLTLMKSMHGSLAMQKPVLEYFFSFVETVSSKPQKIFQAKPFSFPQEKSIKIDNLSKTDKQIRDGAANVSSVSLYVKTFTLPFPFSLCHEMEVKNHCELKPGLSPSGLEEVRHPVYIGKQAHVQSLILLKCSDFSLHRAHKMTDYYFLKINFIYLFNPHLMICFY